MTAGAAAKAGMAVEVAWVGYNRGRVMLDAAPPGHGSLAIRRNGRGRGTELFTIDAIARICQQVQQRTEDGEQLYLVVKLTDGEGALVKAIDFPAPPNEVVQFEIYMPEARSKSVSIFVSPESIARMEIWNEPPPGIESIGPMGFAGASQQ